MLHLAATASEIPPPPSRRRMERTDGKWRVADCFARNGVYVRREEFSPKPIHLLARVFAYVYLFAHHSKY